MVGKEGEGSIRTIPAHTGRALLWSLAVLQRFDTTMTPLHYNRAAWLAASAILGSAVPACAETYLTEAQALGVIFGNSITVRREEHVLDDALRARLEHETNLKFPEHSCTFFLSGQPNQPQKYAIVMNEIGKTEPITFMVGMNDQGKVTEVVIMVFRENRGWEVKEKRFLNQFRGKTIRSSIRVDEDIINYTGATLSSKAVARGVKRALALLNAFYLSETHRAAVADFASPDPGTPILTIATADGRLSLFRQMRHAMGTHCEIRLWCDRINTATRLFGAAFTEIARLEQIFSAYRDDSELAYVNRDAARNAVAVSSEFFELAQFAKQSWGKTRGASDVTIDPLIRLWGFRAGEPRQPSQAEINEARRLVGCDKLVLDPDRHTVRFQRSGMSLDFGGLAKGYAAERVANQLYLLGVTALVNLGGSSLSATALAHLGAGDRVRCETAVSFGRWMIAVKHLDRFQAPPIYFVLNPGESLCTSGTCERQIAVHGTMLSHVLNPHTGLPLSGERSATVIAHSGAHCEASAKQLLLSSRVERKRLFDEWVVTRRNQSGDLELDLQLRRDRFLETTTPRSGSVG